MTQQAAPRPLKRSRMLEALYPSADRHGIQASYDIELSPQMCERIREEGLDEEDVKSLTLQLFAKLEVWQKRTTNTGRRRWFEQTLNEVPCFVDVNARCCISIAQQYKTLFQELSKCFDGEIETLQLAKLMLERGADLNRTSRELTQQDPQGINSFGYTISWNPKLAMFCYHMGCSLKTRLNLLGATPINLKKLEAEAAHELQKVLSPGFDLRTITRDQMMRAANLDCLPTIFDPQRCIGHEMEAIGQIESLPPYLQLSVRQEHLALYATSTPPSPLVEGWSAQLIVSDKAIAKPAYSY